MHAWIVWCNSFPKQQQKAQKYGWLSINMFELFVSIIWLSCQACVSLFDDDSLPKRQKEHNIIIRHQWTFLSLCFNLWLSCQACVSLFDDDSLPNNSNMLSNHYSINIINPWFPICLLNRCAIIFNFANTDWRNTLICMAINKLFNSCELLCFNLWLSCQACVSLFDDDSFFKQQEHNIINHHQLTCLSCFVSNYDCLVQHAPVCLMMTVSSTTQTCCIIIVQSKVSIVDFRHVFSIDTQTIIFNLANQQHFTKILIDFCCSQSMTVDSCTHELMTNIPQANIRNTTIWTAINKSTNIRELFCFNLWLLNGACVSLYDKTAYF